jgi:hypothetical protein
VNPGDLLVVEHKTAGSDIEPGSRYWTRLTLDTQISNYVEGVRALGYGEPAGVLYDVIRKLSLSRHLATPPEERKFTAEKSRACPECKKQSAPPPPHTDGEGRACAEGRVVTEAPRLYAGQRTDDETIEAFRARCLAEVGNNPDKYFQRSVIVRLEEDERDAAFDTWQIGKQIAESQRLNRWPRNPDACELYGRLCEYHPVCTRIARIDDETLYRTTDVHQELDARPAGSLPLLSTSSAKSYRACQRKYRYAYVDRRRPIETSHALRFGSLMHVGLETWWKSVDPDAAVAAMYAAAAQFELDEFELCKAEMLLRGYHVRWSGEPLDVLAVEREFEAPLRNPETGAASRTWLRAGKIDAIARVTPSLEKE